MATFYFSEAVTPNRVMAVRRFCWGLAGMPMLIQKAKIRRITRSFRFTVVFKKPFHDVHTLHTKWLYILLICKLISSCHYKSILKLVTIPIPMWNSAKIPLVSTSTTTLASKEGWRMNKVSYTESILRQIMLKSSLLNSLIIDFAALHIKYLIDTPLTTSSVLLVTL